jgi:hypothetical protein
MVQIKKGALVSVSQGQTPVKTGMMFFIIDNE